MSTAVVAVPLPSRPAPLPAALAVTVHELVLVGREQLATAGRVSPTVWRAIDRILELLISPLPRW